MSYGDNQLKIKVSKAELVEILKKNRKEHDAIYQKAKKGFVKLLRKELQDMLDDLDNGDSLELSFENRKPEKHTEDYDDVIAMLELSVDTELEITHTQYKNWVKDDWDWKYSFNTSNSVYLSAASIN